VDDASKNEKEYYFTFYLGIVSVTLLQFLYFKSQPHHPDHHALRRSRYSGILFTLLIMFYSAALILVGVSYKMMLAEYTEKGAYASYGDRRLLAESSGSSSSFSRVESEERRQIITNLYCFSLAGVFIFLDLLSINHAGLEASTKRCLFSQSGRLRLKGIILVLFFRFGIVAFLVTLSLHVTEPEYVALIGFGAIAMEVVVHIFGRADFRMDDEEEVHQKGEKGGKILACA